MALDGSALFFMVRCLLKIFLDGFRMFWLVLDGFGKFELIFGGTVRFWMVLASSGR